MEEYKESDYLKFNIDAPIRKAVAGMALLGFKPFFSCCGFDYEEQDKVMKKDHLIGKPYMFLEYNDSFNPGIFLQIQTRCGWKTGVTPGFNGGVTIDFHGHGWGDSQPGTPWSKRTSPHNYEIALLSILTLNGVLKDHKNYMLDKVTIIDGNSKYKSVYWQQKPKISWEITKEEWLAMED